MDPQIIQKYFQNAYSIRNFVPFDRWFERYLGLKLLTLRYSTENRQFGTSHISRTERKNIRSEILVLKLYMHDLEIHISPPWDEIH